jgi:monoamine oxidase
MTIGTQSFSKGIAASMTPGSVLLSSPVKEIHQTKFKSIITTRAGAVFECKKVIISVPTPLYKDIVFSPPLKGDKLALSNQTILGYVCKNVVQYSKPWWVEKGFAGLFQSFTGPVTMARDTSDVENGHYSLTCFLVGDNGRAWSKLPAHERRASVLNQLADAYENPEEALNPIEVFEYMWNDDEFAKGAPCPFTAPGTMSKHGHAMWEPVGNLHFVGTETSVEWKGYMEGAVRSGERGAEEVIEALTRLEGKVMSKL